MPENYILLERTELNASAASVTFANIPQTGYTDLKIVVSARGDHSGGTIAFRLNPNGSTTNMTSRVLYGDGSAAASFSDTIAYGNIPGNTSTSNTFGNLEFYIPNYTSSNAKSISCDAVTENNATAALTVFSASLWNSSTTISSLQMLTTVGNLMAGSTFSLYGIAALGTTPAIAPKASGGNIIDFDGTNWIHTFLTSGTFTPQTALNCEYLVIAGGGAGGGQTGGSGAGGYRTNVGGSALSVTTTPILVTVGAGGANPGAGASTAGTKGSNSVFSTITSTGGGQGGSGIGQTGGSGSGAGMTNVAGGAGNEGGYSPVEGFAGGSGLAAGGNTFAGGGGGGSSAVGTNAGGTSAGNGGAGTASSITGTSITRAGGGGGSGNSGGVYTTTTAGSGGSGGGGAGTNSNTVAGSGTVNTGSGGGGAGYSGITNTYGTGGNGGSGIVIIRYPAV
jgi:hypothetical protein